MNNEKRYANWGAFGEVHSSGVSGAKAAAQPIDWDLKITIGKAVIETAPTDTPEQVSAAIRSALDDAVSRDNSEVDERYKLHGRRDALTAVIERARSEAVDYNDLHSIWEALVESAMRENRRPPLLGISEDGAFIRYRVNGKPAYFGKKDLRARLDRQEKARKVP